MFTSWGKETAHKYSREDLDKALHALDEGAYGMILRAKGIVDGGDTWYEFDMVPGEHEIRPCGPDVTGKLCPLYFVDHPDAWTQFLADVKDY